MPRGCCRKSCVLFPGTGRPPLKSTAESADTSTMPRYQGTSTTKASPRSAALGQRSPRKAIGDFSRRRASASPAPNVR